MNAPVQAPAGRQLSQGAANVNWLLENFVRDTHGVEQAIGVSSDGLLMAVAATMPRDEADKFAAVVSGLASLAISASGQLNKGALSQVIIEFGGGYLVVCAISGGSRLGVVTGAEADLGLIGYEITMLAERVGAVLTPELITELKMSLQL
ncbi:roadblock/LC7 domain-containing protein [Euzebya tangerina]|uniref:roadblock/LC7 domain-containing protein n=1 Tax=Euzebya tangerina TaxID=591198 RepID=UPI000E31260E|nr:roadblock/LC7 domain-containing protein [Euzebya tangerina]